MTRIAFAYGCALLLGLFPDGSVSAQIDRTQNALLWRISGNGLAKPSYVFGTMHVSSKIAFELNRPFYDALLSADVVALEMDPNNWLGDMLDNAFFRLGMSANGQGFNLPVQGFYEDAFDVTLPTRSSLQEALSSSPELLNSLLYRITDQRRDHEESTYLDLFIFQCSRKMGKPVIGLESFDDVFSLAIGMMDQGDDDDEKDRKRRREKLREFTKDGRSTDAILEEAYRSEDLLLIDSLYAVMMPSQRAHDAMLGDRNDGMLANMLPVMGPRTLFAAVGAAHLPGERGLVNLLRKAGYTVEPLTAGPDPTTTRMRNDLEQKYLQPTLTPHRSDDGVFSMDLPGNFHKLRMGGASIQLATDPVNGTSVMLQRIPTHGALVGLGPKELMIRLDSLIYASVPGKIGQRKQITMPDGNPGFAITSSTSRGHFLHYRIVVTPLEIAFLKVAHSHAKARKDVDRMLASFRFDTRRTNVPERVELPAVRAGFALPPYRIVDHREHFPLGDQNQGWLDLEAQALGPDGRTYYQVMLATLFDHGHLEEDTFELGRFRQRFQERYKLDVLDTRHGIHEGLPSLRATFLRTGGDTVHGFWTLRGPHYTELAVCGDRSAAERFFTSFQHLEVPPVEAAPFVDELLFFRTDAPTVNHELVGYKGMAAAIRKSFLSERNSKGNEHAFRSQDWMYLAPSSADAVHVNLRKEERYEVFSDTATYWKDRWAQVIRNVPGRLSGRSAWEEDGIRYSEGLITDSTSSRGIRVRFVNKAGATWTLRSVVDAQTGASPWVDLFFNSFMPGDTVMESDLFGDRTDIFFADILGTDSLRQQQAIRGVRTVTFLPDDAGRLLQVLNEVTFTKERTWSRDHLIQQLGATGDQQALPYLRERYRFWADSMDQQITVLQALSKHRSAAGTKAFLDLLLEDPPIPEGYWQMGQVFAAFHDSLEFAVALYPRVLSLSRYPEYKPAVFNLLAALVDKGLVKPALYASFKQEMLTDAQTELKRAVSGGSDDYDDEDSMTSMWTTTFDATWMWDSERDEPYEDKYDPLKIRPYSDGVERYAHLLMPWYEEPSVKAWYNKVLASKAHDAVLQTALYLIHKGKPTPTEVLARYTSDTGSRLWLRHELIRLGRPELFNDAAFTQEDVVVASLMSGRYAMPSDSISVLEVREGASRFGAGKVYLVRVKYEGNENAYLRVAGFQPTDSTEVNWDMRFVHQDGKYEEDKLSERMDKAMERVSSAGRQRVRIKSDDQYDRFW